MQKANDALAEAQDRGLLRSAETIHAQIASRALVYGLARMFIDGHFAQWAVSGSQPEETMRAVLDLSSCCSGRNAPGRRGWISEDFELPHLPASQIVTEDAALRDPSVVERDRLRIFRSPSSGARLGRLRIGDLAQMVGHDA